MTMADVNVTSVVKQGDLVYMYFSELLTLYFLIITINLFNIFG